MHILYVGPLWSGSTCLQRMQAMQDLSHEIVPVNTEPDEVLNKQKQLIYRIWRKMFGPADLANANDKILSTFKQNELDIVWIDKGVTIKQKTLVKLKEISSKTILVHYNPDDPFVGSQTSEWSTFVKALPLYDIHFVPRKPNFFEYRNFGAKEVIQLMPFWGYLPDVHRPLLISNEMSKEFGGPVGFIGDYERKREEMMFCLAKKGISMRIWGPNWDRRCKLSHPNLKIEGKSLWRDDYIKAICAFDIDLGFLRKANRDLHTSRSIEIPACGGFMLAERTDEHLELFEEGKEAEFFENENELLDKINYYLSHPKERKKIAAAGRKRCLKSGYSNQDRIREMFAHISERFGVR